jgi:lysophospholipase L1-like esterase
MMEVAKKKGVQVVAYIAPIRNDVALPYVPEEYAKFKVDVQSMAAEYPNVTFANLEGVVPPAYWGEKNSTNLSNQLELDFMHFNTKGHVVLARELYKLIIKR